MTYSTLEELSRIVARRTGVFIKPEQQEGVVSRFVGGRLRALQLSTPEEYVSLVGRQDPGEAEFTRLIAAVTNQHTFFFRDGEQFQCFAELLRMWRATARGKTLQIWSAGCATGEEPYSLAMLCRDLGVDVRILATDICIDAVEQARKARYRPWALRRLPEGYLERFFFTDGDNLVLEPDVASLVQLKLHNLVDAEYPTPDSGGWDWILCRNVLIYFSSAAAAQVARRLAGALDAEGWIFLGAAEKPTGFGGILRLWPLGTAYGFRLLRPPESPAPEPEPPAPPPAAPPEDEATTNEATPHVMPFLAIADLVRGNDLSAARSELDRLLAADPEHLAARVTLGNLHLRAHDFPEAVAEYQQALAVSPLIPEAHYLLGVVFRKVGDLERSARSLRQALFLEPGFWCASFLLAGVEGRLGHEPARRRHLRHTLSLLDDASTPTRFFSSCVSGMQDVALDPEQVRRLCRRYLG
jgi:chemotaxis protein methyltransferase CheR